MLSSGVLVALLLAGLVGLVNLRASDRAVCQADASGKRWCMAVCGEERPGVPPHHLFIAVRAPKCLTRRYSAV